MVYGSDVGGWNPWAGYGTDVRGALGELEPVGLDEMIATADLQVRHDSKYLVPASEVGSIVERMANIERPRVLDIGAQRLFRYQSLYFDSPELTNYLASAYRRPRRTKIRTRTYLDSGICMLEVKMRDNSGNTVKHRLPYALEDSDELTAEGYRFIESTCGAEVTRLIPQLTSSYSRATLIFDESGVRATVDMGLGWRDRAENSIAIPRFALLETKSSTRFSNVDRMLWSFGHRPVSISKYCTGLAALRPAIPANKWHRTLKHFMTDGVARA